jgi:hypothetical protein
MKKSPDTTRSNLSHNLPSARLFKGGLLALGLSGLMASSLSAATLAYWEFETPSLTVDSSGNNYTLTMESDRIGAYTLPTGSGAGSAFPKTIYGQANTQAIQGLYTDTSFSLSNMNAPSTLTTALNSASSFTLEAFINMSAKGTSTRSILGLGGGQTDGCWTLGVSSGTSGLGDSVLFFQYARDTGTWGNNSLTNLNTHYQIEVGKDYYIALSMNKFDETTDGVIFYIKNLTDDTDMVTITLSRSAAAATMYDSTTYDLTIGNSITATPWAGTIDNVRISDAQVAVPDLLISNIPEASSAMWLGGLIAVLAAMRFIRRRR